MMKERTRNLGLVVAMGVALGLTGQAAGEEAEVTYPASNWVNVTRTEGNLATQVFYVVEVTGDSVKYEDAADGLGEDKVVQTDRFSIAVDGGGDTVSVETKAKTSTATTIAGAGDVQVDALGFEVNVVSINNGVYTVDVTSVSAKHALSHITFTFSESEQVASAYD